MSTNPTRLNLREAAAYCRLSPSTLKTAVRGGGLRAIAPPGMERQRLFFEAEDLDAWLSEAESRSQESA